MEPEKTVKKKKINLHVNSSTTVKRRSKNFYTVQTTGEVSAKLLLWWNEKYPFRNAKIVVKNRTSVCFCLLTRTFSLKFLHVYDANVLYQCKNPQGSLALHISLMRNEGARWAADTSLQRLNMKNTRS